MFNSIKSAKRKVITFDDDDENVSFQGHDTQSTPTPTENKSNKAIKAKSQTDSESSAPASTSESHAEEPTPSSATTLTKKQKRQQQHQYDRPKKIANKEPTTEAIIAKAKDLKKHREALPIYTGKHSAFIRSLDDVANRPRKLTCLSFHFVHQ